MHNYLFILPVIGLVSSACLGAFTLFRNPRHPANISFAAGMAALGVIELGGALVLLSGEYGAALAPGIMVSLSGLSLLPAAWIPFSCIFARKDYRQQLIKWAYVLALMPVLSVIFIMSICTGGILPPVFMPQQASIFSEASHYIVLGPLGKYLFVYILLGLVANLVHLENTLRSSKGSGRWHIKYVIFGAGAVMAYFIYLSSQALLFSSLSYETVPLTSSVIIISTFIMAVFIVKHKLLDVDIFISRYVIYNSFTVLAVGLYLLAVGLISQSIKFFNLPFTNFLSRIFVFASMLALIALLFVATLRRKAQLFINRHFYKHKYEFRDKWMETTEGISSKRSLDELCETLKEMILENMCSRPVHLWLYDHATGGFKAHGGGIPTDLNNLPQSHPLSKHLSHMPGPFMDVQAPDSGTREVFDATSTVLCAPLVAGMETVGFIMLGPDISGEKYVQDDFEFLKAVGTQAAVQIKNIRLTNALMASKEVEAFSRMSSFIMHDLKNLTNSLSLVSQNASANIHNPEFQRDAIKTIDGTVSRMKSLIQKLSDVPRDIELRKEQADLHDIVRRIMKKTGVAGGKEIIISNEVGILPAIYVDSEAIEMVIFNLVANACDAISKKGLVRVRGALNDGYITISVSDNGSGMTKEYISTALFQPFKTTKKSGFGIGLFQCKSIIEAHGGEINVKSEPGAGSEFTVRLPLDAESNQRDSRADGEPESA